MISNKNDRAGRTFESKRELTTEELEAVTGGLDGGSGGVGAGGGRHAVGGVDGPS